MKLFTLVVVFVGAVMNLDSITSVSKPYPLLSYMHIFIQIYVHTYIVGTKFCKRYPFIFPSAETARERERERERER